MTELYSFPERNMQTKFHLYGKTQWSQQVPLGPTGSHCVLPSEMGAKIYRKTLNVSIRRLCA